MKVRIWLANALVMAGFAAGSLLGQDPPPAQASDEATLRITVTLVQVDAVVTDSKGKHIADLKPQDFEIRQDGKLQKITHFSYVSLAPQGAKAQPAVPQAKGAPAVKGAAAVIPPVPMKASQVRRTVALVVDDLGLSFESIAQVRSSVKKWVDQQMQPGDLVAIIRTGAGMGALQQFTSDKRMLYASIDRIKWNSYNRVGISSFAPINDSQSEEEAAAEQTENEFREERFSVGTLGAIGYVVQGLKDLPGRKAVIIFSENIPILQPGQGMNTRITDALEKLTDSANRAAVVLNTIDPRGLPTLSFTAADNVRPDPRNPGRMQEQQMARSQKYFESQNGLNYLAEQTGGLFIHDTNDINRGIQDIVEDASGYYLIGYTPEAGTFDKDKKNPQVEKFHRVKVRVLRSGLTVRSRSGFLGTPDSQRPVGPKTRDEQLAQALSSPFGSTGIKVRLTSLFNDTLKNGSYVQSMLFIDPKDLRFTDDVAEPPKDAKAGTKPVPIKKAVVDIVTMTFGDNGQEQNRRDMTYTIRLPLATFDQVMKQGFVYTVYTPIKKPGAFQLRAAVRDTATSATGSASQFMEVPDVKKGKIVLSGIVLKAAAPELLKAAKMASEAEKAGQDGHPEDNSDGSPAVRKFKQGQPITYGYQVINSTIDSKTQKPQVETEMRLYRDGKPVYTGAPAALNSTGQTDLKRIVNGGLLRLGAKMTPGEYVLQVVATDKLGSPKNNKATQWIDFEVVPGPPVAAVTPANPPAAAAR
jgi:VWFA-related protein